MFDSRREVFANRADIYDAAIRRAPDARAAELALALGPVPLRPGLRLCDVPSAGGYLLGALRGRGIDYVAVEPTPDFFDRIPEEEGVTRLLCPITAIELDDAGVDALVSVAGLHHEPDLGRVFGEFRRVLRPGGIAVIMDGEAGSTNADFLNSYVDAHNPMGHDGMFLDGRTAGQLAAAGFEVIEDRMHDVPWVFTDETEMGEFLRLLFGAIEVTPGEIATAAAAALGVRDDPKGIALNWPMRRLVCR